jgi:hypothetical protein
MIAQYCRAGLDMPQILMPFLFRLAYATPDPMEAQKDRKRNVRSRTVRRVNAVLVGAWTDVIDGSMQSGQAHGQM